MKERRLFRMTSLETKLGLDHLAIGHPINSGIHSVKIGIDKDNKFRVMLTDEIAILAIEDFDEICKLLEVYESQYKATKNFIRQYKYITAPEVIPKKITP
jgi:hypothetical protein